MDADRCELCDQDPIDRRRFISRVGGAAAALALSPALAWDAIAEEAEKAPQTLSLELFGKLGQHFDRRIMQDLLHPSDTPLLNEVHANWMVSPLRVRDMPRDLRSLTDDVLRSAVSRASYRRFRRQMRDDSGGLDEYSVGFCGVPNGDGELFQLMITGRHFTLRVDGNYDDKIAFGGPILYGHGEERRAELNLWYDHVLQGTSMCDMLDGKQRRKAVTLSELPDENVVTARPAITHDGISFSELSDDQLAHAIKVIERLLGQYGPEAIKEMRAVIAANGGWSKLSLAFYSRFDRHFDGKWDVWRVEGPGFLYFFRGEPHVHAYINIGKQAGGR